MPLISGTPDLQMPSRAGSHGDEPWPLNVPCRFFFSARYALFHALRALGLGPNDRILVPAYCCGTEVDPILAAGLSIEWCDVEESLDVARGIPEALETPGLRAVLLTHYFGVDRLPEELVGLLRTKRILIIEDCSHAFLSSNDRGQPLGTAGDAAVFSLRKSLGIADGGVLVLSREFAGAMVPAGSLRPPNRLAVWYRALELIWRGTTLAQGGLNIRRALARALAGAALQSKLSVRAFRKVTGRGRQCLVHPNGYEFVPEAVWWGMSDFTRRRLGCEHRDVLRRRRENFLHLQHLVADLPGVRRLLPDLPSGACPLLFPILLPNRATVHELLAREGIDSHPWWGYFHPAVPWNRFPLARRLKAQVLGLPVHQGLTGLHMERIADGLRAAVTLPSPTN